MSYKNVYPKTIESAAEIVIDALSKEDLAIIKKQVYLFKRSKHDLVLMNIGEIN